MKKISLLLLLVTLTLESKSSLPSDTVIQGRLNIINGASAECVMHYFYTKDDWIHIEGEIGRNGIDGLYYKMKNNVVKEVLVAESKWNTSNLGTIKHKTIKQMSQAWILNTMKKLLKIDSSLPYDAITKLIKHNQYRARLFRLKPVSNNAIQITTYKIKNKGDKNFYEIKERSLDPIRLNNPTNNFQKNVLTRYNICRKQYLNKYLPSLNDKSIETLLQDNYIQKVDIKNIFKGL